MLATIQTWISHVDRPHVEKWRSVMTELEEVVEYCMYEIDHGYWRRLVHYSRRKSPWYIERGRFSARKKWGWVVAKPVELCNNKNGFAEKP